MMLSTPRRGNLNKIVVLNPKGGCGKTTLVTNLASRFAQLGPLPAIMDFDPQGSTMRWLEQRPGDRPPVYGVAAFRPTMQTTRSWQLRVPEETTTLIVDSPAGIASDELCNLTRDATSILVPVLPSAIDIHAASRCIADLLLIAKVDRRERKLAVVANRTRSNTKSFASLMRFLRALDIPIVGIFRDTQNFVQAAELGLGVCELTTSRARPDIEQVDKVVNWLSDYRNRERSPARARRIETAANVTELHPAKRRDRR